MGISLPAEKPYSRSNASPTFRNLDPNAGEVIGVAAFFPQGVDENDPD